MVLLQKLPSNFVHGQVCFTLFPERSLIMELEQREGQVVVHGLALSSPKVIYLRLIYNNNCIQGLFSNNYSVG